MIRQCCICKKIYGEKKPYEDKRITHGYCLTCEKRLLSDIITQKKNKKERRRGNELY